MEDKSTNLDQIGEFIVTDRPLRDTKESLFNNQQSISTIFHLGENWLNQLPQNARILNIGSGVNRLFENQIKQDRSDIYTVSIDPTPAIDFKDNPNKWYIEEYDNGDYLIYKRGDKSKSPGGYNIPEDHEAYQKNRIGSMTEVPGTVIALAPHLPILPGTIDVFFDTFGPSRYIEDTEQSHEYLTRLHDSLKSGGIGYMNFIVSSRLKFLQSFADLNVEILESSDIKINGTAETVHTLKLTKVVSK